MSKTNRIESTPGEHEVLAGRDLSIGTVKPPARH
jgi:hypothetical protein